VQGSLLMGIVLTMIAGLMSGNCMLPLKFTRSWKWENVWLVFSVLSLVILPWALAIGLVNHLFETYRALPVLQLAIPVLLGAGWGIAQILFGISVVRLGLGLAYAVIVGLGAVLGTLVPLFAGQHASGKPHAITYVLGGVVVMMTGIALTAWGGQIREGTTLGPTQVVVRQGYMAAIMLAVLCGFMAPMLNYSFAFGQSIAQQAVRLGNPAVRAAYAVWPIGLAGGFLPNIGYSLYLLSRNRTWSAFRSLSPDLFSSSLMGALWMGAFALYGMSAAYLGSLGTSIGWGLFQIFMIMTATLSGVWTGEWKHAPRQAILLLSSGLVCLTGATILLALGNR
jgi:L-rhamnose-proton symport protein (RhaT)